MSKTLQGIRSSEKILSDVSSEFNTTPINDQISTPSSKLEVEYSKKRKYFILLLVSFAGLLAPIASAIYFPSLLDIQKELKTTDALMNLTVSGFLATMAITPLFWGSFSDAYGRRGVNIISLVLFILSSIGCALSNSIELLIIMRIIQGIGSSASMVTGVGTIGDIFNREERGSAIGLCLVGPLIGPVLGPLIGGYVNEYLGWRVIFYLLSALGGLVLIGIVFALPETLPSSSKQKFPLKITTRPPFLRKQGKLLNPFEPLVYLADVKVSLITFYASIIFSAYYLISSTQAKTLSSIYHLSSSGVGLSYIPLGLGNLIGSSVGGKVSDMILNRESKKRGTPPPPEVRLYGVFFGAISVVAGLLMLGWFLESSQPLGAILFAQFLIGLGMMNVFSGTSTYLIDLYPEKSASIISCNTCVRTIAAAIVTSVSNKIIGRLDFGWSFSLFGFLQIPGILMLTFLALYGQRLNKQ